MSYLGLTPWNPDFVGPVWSGSAGALVGPESGNANHPLANLPWSTPERLTISFAPDGTRIAGFQSDLYETFSDMLTANQLEARILKAFQRWSRYSSVNVGYVDDSGLQFGVSGPSQGDQRVGDIRVGAIPMANDVYAVAVRHDSLMSGTWSGDLLFNSNQTFADAEQIFAVALHEAGHVLGLEHSTNSAAAMYPGALNGTVIGADIAALRKLHGARRIDQEDVGNKHNNTLERATRIENPGSLNGEVPLIVFGDLHVDSDVDYFELSPLSNYQGAINFELVSRGISLLRAELSVFNEAGQLVQSSVGGGIRGDRLSISVPAIDGETYFARVRAVDQSLYATGSYAVKATFEAAVTADPQLIESVLMGDYWRLRQSDVRKIFLEPATAFFNQELMLNDTPATADRLKTSLPHAAAQHYQTVGSLSYLNDIDFFEFRTPDTLSNDATITVGLNLLDRGRLVPLVEVFDSNLQLLEAEILVNGNQELILQVAGVDANTDYFVRVVADNPGDAYDQGNYQFWTRFDLPAQTRNVLASGSLSSATPQLQRQDHSLYVAETQMFHLGLKATGSVDREQAQVWLTIYNVQGNPVFRTLTFAGQTRTAKSVVLRPGTYTIVASLAVHNPLVSSVLDYTLTGTGITDPIGPLILDPSKQPFKKAGPGDPNYVYPGNQLSPNPYLISSGNPNATPPGAINEPPYVTANAWYWHPGWLTPEVPNM